MKTLYIGFFLLFASYILAQSPAYPVLTGVILDACNTDASTPSCATLNGSTAGNCSEGRSEVAFFRAGTTAITPAKVQAMTTGVINLYTTIWTVLQYFSGISMNNAAVTTTLNSTGCGGGSCGACFQDAWTTGIPAGATFIMVADYYCVGTTDYTALCGNATTSPIYVIYFGVSTNNSNPCGGGTTGQWDASGNYTNNGAAAFKGIEIDMSSLVAGAPTQYYKYDISLEANCGATDGAGVTYDEAIGSNLTTGTAAIPKAYTSCNCTPPVVLPTSILNFIANRSEENILISWETAAETNSDYFGMEYSIDGENFISYKEVKAAGNSTEIKKYSCIFTNEIVSKIPYFRLKQVDNNGNFKFSKIISLANTSGTSLIKVYYNADNYTIINKFKLDTPSQINFSLYDITGREVYASINQFSEGDNQFLIPAPEYGGVYMLVYQNGSAAPVHKKVMVTK